MLLQRRSFSKYHSGGLWTNTCCSHPRQKESVEDAAHRRLQEEMGFDCKLFTLFTFIYQGVLDKGLQEHELDHVLYGIYSGDVIPDSEEVSAYRWVGTQEIIQEVQKYPEKFTIWFQLSLNRVLSSF